MRSTALGNSGLFVSEMRATGPGPNDGGASRHPITEHVDLDQLHGFAFADTARTTSLKTGQLPPSDRGAR